MSKNTLLTLQTFLFLSSQLGGLLISKLGIEPLIWVWDTVVPGIWLYYFAKIYKSKSPLYLFLAVIYLSGSFLHTIFNSLNNNLADEHQLKAIAYFIDEYLSHWMVFAGHLGLIIKAMFNTTDNEKVKIITVVAGVINGLFTGLALLEAKLLVFAFIMLWMIFIGKSRINDSIVDRFYLVSAFCTCLLMLLWGLYWGGFPEPFSVLN